MPERELNCSMRCRQETWPAATALALLYLTVLSFGLLSTAYLNWRGLSEAELSVYRGLGALAGILATFAFPHLHSSLGRCPLNALSFCDLVCCIIHQILLPLPKTWFLPLLLEAQQLGSLNRKNLILELYPSL